MITLQYILDENTVFDTEQAQQLLTVKDLYAAHSYYKTSLGNYVKLSVPYERTQPATASLISEEEAKEVLSGHNTEEYLTLFGDETQYI